MSNSKETAIRYLGGEAGHRSFFGGTSSTGRTIGLAVSIVGGIIGMEIGRAHV